MALTGPDKEKQKIFKIVRFEKYTSINFNLEYCVEIRKKTNFNQKNSMSYEYYQSLWDILFIKIC